METPDKQSLWDSVLAELQLTLSSAIYQTWFKGKTTLLSVKSGVIEIGCYNSYNKIWLEERYLGQIKGIVDRLTGQSNALVFSVSAQAHRIPKKQVKRKLPATVPLFEEEAGPDLAESLASANVNRKYSISNFITGNSNRLAFAVAKAVIESPQENYNPLLIHGGVGVGKTHLLQAIGQAVILRRSKVKVLYCSSETFTNDMIDAIQKRQTFSFREKYRGIDLLLVDDIQFLAGRESTQEQFFHTFNHLVVQGKQVVVSCDRNPKDLHNLQDRLKSRFSGGMVAGIDRPDQELREAVLLARSKNAGVDLGFAVIRQLAQVLGPSIRDVEGGLTRLLAVSKLTGKPISNDLINEVIGSENKISVGGEDVLNETAKYFSVSPKDLKSDSRARVFVFPRQVAMYLLRTRLKMSFNRTASYFGGKDHSTAVYSVKRVEELLKTDAESTRLVSELSVRVFGG